ncbi:hypothetical protein L3X38_008206 [Prunus dulcis]|uniref:Uncharacterized protein n=1 Tax=Prunus dulcis TaxID=3755 RepID=A0AAD4ZWF6_PRUDU|nr:hypothetical protein L3X38_008206 [Prunus dulcis]
MAGTNDIKIKGFDLSNNSGNTSGLTHFANRADKGDKGDNKIQVEDAKAAGNTGDLKVLTDFAQRGKVGESDRQQITGSKPLQTAA